ncbi:MAG: hypothetical protein DCC67_10465 [Planctomycetota bacterium]|nr:MAG: hypothetical protein DCC67_10465 [Planctomycetota bacterium]
MVWPSLDELYRHEPANPRLHFGAADLRVLNWCEGEANGRLARRPPAATVAHVKRGKSHAGRFARGIDRERLQHCDTSWKRQPAAGGTVLAQSQGAWQLMAKELRRIWR